MPQVLEVFDQYRSPYGYGPQEMTLTWRRDATTKAIREGDPYFVDIDQLPNPGTNQRGGTRLVRCLSWRENGPLIIHRILDLGPGTTPASPTVGALALETGNTSHGVTVTITLAAGNYAEVEFAVTDTGVATVGAVADNLWARHFFLSATQAITVRSFPANKRVWVRARSVPGPGSIARIPSGWAHASGADFIDTDPITAPTGLAVGSINEKSAQLTWNAVNHPVEIHLVSPSGTTIDDTTVWKTVPAGTAHFWVSGTVASATYKADIRSIDGSGGTSAFDGAVTWTATGAVATAPTPLGLAVINAALP